MTKPTPEQIVRYAWAITHPSGFVGDLNYWRESARFITSYWATSCLKAVELATANTSLEELERLYVETQTEKATALATRIAAIAAGQRASATNPTPSRRAEKLSAAERSARTAELLASLNLTLHADN